MCKSLLICYSTHKDQHKTEDFTSLKLLPLPSNVATPFPQKMARKYSSITVAKTHQRVLCARLAGLLSRSPLCSHCNKNTKESKGSLIFCSKADVKPKPYCHDLKDGNSTENCTQTKPTQTHLMHMQPQVPTVPVQNQRQPS
jgi:hypothetical protein